MKKLLSIIILLSLCSALRTQAQCTAENTAFKSGETLLYDLYFNWKFVWVKVGTASMNISSATYQGEPAYRT